MNRVKHGVDKIDIIWVYDPKKPAVRKVMRTGRITRKNSKRFLRTLMSLGYVNQYLDSFSVMNLKRLEKFVKDNSDRYIIDPSMREIRGGKAFYPYVFEKLLAFYKERGFLPLLSCSSDTLSWARRFLEETGGYPVVVQLRNNQLGRKKLNSSPKAWLGFFTECRNRFKEVKFIIVSGKGEIDLGFEKSVRALGNVVFSKKHGKLRKRSTTIEQDCALIQASKIFMGSSGTMVMAMFAGTPCLAFNHDRASWRGSLTNSQQLFFATPFQKLIWKNTSKKVIMKKFEKLYRQLVKTKGRK